MGRGIFTFLMLWALLSIGITGFQTLSGSEKWSVIKTVFCSALLALVSAIILMVVVVIF